MTASTPQQDTLAAIDVHTHFVPEHLPSLPAGMAEATWPYMVPGGDCCHRHVMVQDKIYRTVSNQCWDAATRVADMAGSGITRQCISPMPELLSYWMPGPVAAVLHRDINRQMAELAAAHPGKFDVLAAVPLQDVALAIEEMEYAARELHCAGVEIGSNINGRVIGAPEFEPFFAAAERLGMAIFVHAIRPVMERVIGPPNYEQVVGFPNEIGHAALSCVTGNLMERHPDLKICFSHGGGALAMLLPRLQHAWTSFPNIKAQMPTAPFEQARKMFYDTLVYDRDTLQFLLTRFGADALIVGTDYPFNIMETDPLGRLTEAEIDGLPLQKLRYRNALRFLAGKD